MKIAHYEKFGKIVTDARKLKGLEQGDLARLVGTTQQNISRWEAGRSRPRPKQLGALSAALGMREEILRAAVGHGAATEILPATVTVSHDQPLPVDALSPESFQRFTEDLVRGLHADAQDIGPVGKTGQDQDGTDILCILADGRRLSYQCKRVTRFGPADVRAAVAAHTAPADHKYLVLSRPASPQTAEELRAFPDWTLWDKDDIARLVRQDLSATQRRVLVDKYFPGQRYALLGEPNPGPWQTPEEFFAPFAGRRATFSHDWALVGRTDEVATIVNGLHDDNTRIVLLLGAGGSGKSRILKSIVTALATREPRLPLFLSPSETLSGQALEMLGPGPQTVIVDDAHDRSDLGGLFAYAAHPARNIRILLSARPYARERLRGQAGIFARGGAIEEVVLPRLSLDDTINLARDVLERFGGAPEFAEPIARATRDCPLVTVLAGRIAVEQKLPVTLAQNAGAFQDTILGKFAEIITGALAPPGEQKMFTDILKLISLVQPFAIDDPMFLDMATTLAQESRDKVSATLRMLIDGGIVFRRGTQYRLMPDLLGDYIIERSCIGADERLDSFADQVFEMAVPPLLGHVLVNLGRLDWRRTSGDPAKRHLVTHLWRALKVTGGYHDSGLEAAAAAAIYQPRQALDFVTRQWRAGIRHDDLVKIIRNTAYHLDYLVEACQLLWEIGRADDREQGRFPSHAMRTLKELCEVEPAKPIAFNKEVVTFGLGLLDGDDAFDTLYSPFDFLKGILSGEGYTTKGDNRTITFAPFTVNYAVVEDLRAMVVARAITLLTGPSLRAAGRAAAFIESALRYPMVSFGGRLSEELRAQYTEEFASTLGRLRKLVQARKPDPVVAVALAHAVAWHAHYAGGETGKAANALLESLPTNLEFRLLAALSDGFGRVFLGRMDANTWQSRLNKWVGDLVADLSAAHPKPAALKRLLEDDLALTEEAGLAKDNSSHVLVHEVLRKRVDLAQRIVEATASGEESRLTRYLDAALVQVLHAVPDAARRYARQFLDSGTAAMQRAVGRAFNNPPMPDGALAPADAEIIKRVLSSDNADVVLSGLGVLSTLAQKNSRVAIDLLRHANLKIGAHVADHAFMMLHGLYHDMLAVLDENDVHFLLRELTPIPELTGYWIETLLAHLSEHFPQETVKFFLDRVNAATASDDTFSRSRPINYGPWVHERLRFKQSQHYRAVLKSVWQWMVAHDPGDWRFEHHASALFEGLFLPLDDTVLDFLAAKMTTADARGLRWIASVLAHADEDFVFDHHKLVVSFLELCDDAGDPVRRKALDALYRATISGVRSGTPGEPFPRDVECRDKAVALLARLPRLSPAFELYDMLRAHSEHSIEFARKDGEAFDDV
ncbi:MAG TPA: helix-turn-helix domain-containing protein [Rhizomicrobium sp.]|jgi:transcriptional regulator with XRE-family HTH domain